MLNNITALRSRIARFETFTDTSEPGIDCSVSDAEVNAQIALLEQEIDDLEQELVSTRENFCVVEVSMADLAENDYSAYCAIYELMFGYGPDIQRQAE